MAWTPEAVAADLDPIVGEALDDVAFADLVDRVVAQRRSRPSAAG